MGIPFRLAIAFAVTAAFGGAAIVHALHDSAGSDICIAPESLAAR